MIRDVLNMIEMWEKKDIPYLKQLPLEIKLFGVLHTFLLGSDFYTDDIIESILSSLVSLYCKKFAIKNQHHLSFEPFIGSLTQDFVNDLMNE